LPKVVPLSSENLDNDGIFLLENGEDGFFYVGRQASSEILHQLFGVQSVEEVASGQVKSSPLILTCIPLKVAIQQ
jgi:protein transport protein SEC24